MLGASPTLESNYWFGAQGNRLWVGQIEGDGAVTITGDKCEDYQESNRVKVRIMGYHTRSRNQLKPQDLPWASVLMPTTETITRHSSGTVHGLENGMWVLGTFMDGESAQQPLVMGSIGIVDKRQDTYTDRVNNEGLSNDHSTRAEKLVQNNKEGSGGHGQSIVEVKLEQQVPTIKNRQKMKGKLLQYRMENVVQDQRVTLLKF